MGTKTLPILLVTANVGSIFEDPSVMLKIWTEEFLSTVAQLDSKFIALHCQEVGGKNYEKSMNYVEDFVKLLITSEELRLFDKVRVFIDEDYSSAENFTALGNIYFIHETIHDVLIWDFQDLQFVDVEDSEMHTGNIESVVTKEKAKFPQDFFPECKWSRKGFMRTRWSVNGTVFDLINIHLFHDASNFVAMEMYPSVYCKNRRRALEHTLQRFHNDRNGTAPFFVFGDFNFRTDTDGVIKKLTDGLVTTKVQHNNKNNEYTKLLFHNHNEQLILTVGKKEFNHFEHQDVFLNSDGSWLKSYDREPEAFESQLFEFPVTFPPSYPFEENVVNPSVYMQTRCPAWCDRILLSHTARALVEEDTKGEYNMIGRNTCMGDHKPVYLHVSIRQNSGIVQCCQHKETACLTACKCCQSYASIEINIIDLSEYLNKPNSYTSINHALLHEPITRDMLNHDPYTPESADSHSPMPEEKTRDLFELVSVRKSSVPPALLKSKLENILKDGNVSNVKRSKNTGRYLTKSLSEQLDFVPEIALRVRCNTETTKKHSRAKLISAESAQSMCRLQSHHSSSDEDWFDFEDAAIEDEVIEINNKTTGNTYNSSDNTYDNISSSKPGDSNFQMERNNDAIEYVNKYKIKATDDAIDVNKTRTNKINSDSCDNISLNKDTSEKNFEIFSGNKLQVMLRKNNSNINLTDDINKNERNKRKINKTRGCCCSIS